jgi:hypothetical protein
LDGEQPRQRRLGFLKALEGDAAVNQAARVLALGGDPWTALRVPLGPEELIFEAALKGAEEHRKSQHRDLAEAVSQTIFGS